MPLLVGMHNGQARAVLSSIDNIAASGTKTIQTNN